MSQIAADDAPGTLHKRPSPLGVARAAHFVEHHRCIGQISLIARTHIHQLPGKDHTSKILALCRPRRPHQLRRRTAIHRNVLKGQHLNGTRNGRNRIRLGPHALQHRRRLIQHAGAANQIDLAARVHLTFAMHDDALSRSGIHGARHLWPALGHIGTRVGTRVKSDFERIARRHGGIKLNRHLFVTHRHQVAHAHALVDRALKAHELGTRTTPQVSIGKPTVKRPSQLAFKLFHGTGVPRAVAQYIECPTPHPHHVEYVIGILHASLDLERCHAGGNKLGQVRDTQIVTRTKQAVSLDGNNTLPRLVH